MSKFLSRKFLLALAGFVTVNVIPNLSAGTQARLSAGIAAAYALAEGLVDALAALKGTPKP